MGIEEVLAWSLVAIFGFVVVAVIGTLILLFASMLTFGFQRETKQYINDIEETTEESEFDGLLGIEGEEDELFPPESDLGDDEN